MRTVPGVARILYALCAASAVVAAANNTNNTKATSSSVCRQVAGHVYVHVHVYAGSHLQLPNWVCCHVIGVVVVVGVIAVAAACLFTLRVTAAGCITPNRMPDIQCLNCLSRSLKLSKCNWICILCHWPLDSATFSRSRLGLVYNLNRISCLP